MLNQFKKHRSSRIVLVFCLGILISYCSIHIWGELVRAEDILPEMLSHILTNELQGIQFTSWDENTHTVQYHYGDDVGRVIVSGPIEYDLNDDGRLEVVVGCVFPEKLRTQGKADDEDFLAIYTIVDDGLSKQVFKKSFEPRDEEYFEEFQVSNITKTGVPAIQVMYSAGNVGAIRWEWESFFYIIRGYSPFDTLLELNVYIERGSVKENEYLTRTDIEVEDLDNDGVNEIMAVRYEGKDLETLRGSTPEILTYRANFTLTTYSIGHLHKKGLPEEIVQGLQPLAEQEFASKGDFLSAVEQLIGEEDMEKYETLLVQYGIYRYQLENE